mmetsp:Transcript_46784/g.98268  ORF Transcript_46784/g.98268 Transcript_46784/m.98268 type:complete len:421 (+) Transcript_46784:359-1621(+)
MGTSGQGLFITNILMEVSQFLDVESTIHLSETCRTLHEALVDDPNSQNPKIKVSNFTLGDLSAVVLPKIHFPSLKRFEFRFPSGTNKSRSEARGGLRDLFMALTVQLKNMTNLEEFHMDVGLIMNFDAFNTCMTYDVFAKNLAKCTRLRRLKVFNQYVVPGLKNQSFYSPRFLRALLPAMTEREGQSSSLEEVTLLIGNRPIAAKEISNRSDDNAARDLFSSILRLQRLREFNLQLNLASSPLLNEFLIACDDLHRRSGVLPSKSIEKCTLLSLLYKVPEGAINPLPAPLSLAPFLALFGKSSILNTVLVRVPSACWDSRSISELKNLVSAKPKLRHLGLFFNRYKCTTGETVECILNYIQEREMYSDNIIHISGLEPYDGSRYDEEEALDRYYSREGQKCLSWDANGLVFEARGYMIGW